jgi:hypothetical protein
VAQTDVTLTRDAIPSQAKGKKPPVPGKAIKARLVVSRIMSEDGKVLAQWLLLSNVKEQVSAATLALWYYWRWRIESFFKLLKSEGHELEAWQQESAQAIAKRLLVASMACVTVWAIAAEESVQAAELRAFLIKLSGRQMKRGKDFTHPALLAGLWVWLSMLEVMDSYTPDELLMLTPAENCPPKCRYFSSKVTRVYSHFCLIFRQEQKGDHHGNDGQGKADEFARWFVAQ